MVPRLILFALVLALGAYAIMRTKSSIRGKQMFRAVATKNGIVLTGMVPTLNNSDMEDFLAALMLPVGCRLDCFRRDQQLAIYFSNDFPETHRQQVRNVLLNPSGGRL